jgi:hypothetical protein
MISLVPFSFYITKVIFSNLKGYTTKDWLENPACAEPYATAEAVGCTYVYQIQLILSF